MKDKVLVFFCFAIIALLAFLKLGQHPIEAWDEARRAINAIEMLQTGDFVNLRFSHQPDTWNNKPPFAVWCEALSFKALGFNELALRLPSALAIVLAFAVIFNLIRLYRSPAFSALTCLLLASVKGLIGWHIGRTGDTDAMLLFWLMASLYFFARTLDFGQKWAAVPFGLCLGMAYLSKGAAAFTLLPGLALYMFFSKRGRLVPSRQTWAGLAIAAAFPIVWGGVQSVFGQKTTTGTAFDRQVSVDLLRRFVEPVDGLKPPFEFGFLFTSLDKIFNLWHFAFFGFLAFGLFLGIKNGHTILQKLTDERHRLLLLSLCLYFPLAIFLSMAAKSNRWYLAPALPFVGIATFWGIRYFWHQKNWVKWAFYGLLAFTLGRQFWLFWNVPPRPALATSPIIAQAKTIVVVNNLPQDKLCYLYFHGKNMRFGTSGLQVGEVAVANATQLPMPMPTNWEKTTEASGCLIFTIKK